MSCENALSRGKRILQMSLISSTSSVSTVTPVSNTGQTDNNADMIYTNESSPTVDEMFSTPVSNTGQTDNNADMIYTNESSPTVDEMFSTSIDNIAQPDNNIKRIDTNESSPKVDEVTCTSKNKLSYAPTFCCLSDEISPDSFEESFESDDSLIDPDFTPTKRDLKKAELSTDDDEINEYSTATGTEKNPLTQDEIIIDHEEVVVSKKKAKRGRAEPENWKRNMNKYLRMEGKEYKSTNSTIRKSRQIQPRKCTVGCESDKRKQCNNLSEEDRQQMFVSFWAMTWDEKKVLISNLVERKGVQERTTASQTASRRNYSFFYYLKKGGIRVPVCKNMLLTTLCIGEKTVYKWVNTTTEAPKAPRSRRSRIRSVDKSSELYLKAFNFLDSLPKLESHYCRSTSSKLYLEPVFSTFMSLYNLYMDNCRNTNIPIMNRTSFKNIFDEMNLSLFKPRKDQCDLCCSHEVGNVDDEQYNYHIERKNSARTEKTQDKEAAMSDDSLAVITVDVQAVLLCPSLQASALYYKTKLTVHNFTVYDLASADVTCYVWHEGEGDLTANTFSSFLVDYINHLGKNIKTLVIYSDGCGYQNRNSTLSNALYKLAVEDNLTIYQKFLEKGHTQMEVDSVHSSIERKLRKQPIYCPQQYVDYIKKSRTVPRPYNVKYIAHDFFKDYKNLNYYSSIRPGTKVGDPVVNDIRVLKYNPGKDGRIEFKLRYSDELQELPRRFFVKSPGGEEVGKAYTAPLKIKSSKYNHLQELKSVIPKDYHSFYDNLLH